MDEQAVEGFDSRAESPAKVKAFIQMRIERFLEDAALLAVEFCPTTERARFLNVAGAAFDRIQEQHSVYAKALGEKKNLHRLWIFATIEGAASTLTVTGPVAPATPREKEGG